jgi:hypothetical protein
MAATGRRQETGQEIESDAAPSGTASARGDSPALQHYCLELRRWLDGQSSDIELRRASATLCEDTRRNGLPPERMLIMIHAMGLPRRARNGGSSDSSRDRRYVVAIEVLLRCYFAADGALQRMAE